MSNNFNPDRKKMPPLGAKQFPGLHEPEITKLDNGIPLYIIDGEDSEVTRFDLVFEAGTALQKKKLVAASVNKLLGEGTRKRTAFEISKFIDYHGAYIDQFVNKDTAGLTLYALTKYYDRLLPLIFEMITDATFPEKELQVHLSREYHDYKVKINKVRYRATLEFNRMMFGKETPYGQVVEEHDFDRLTRGDLTDFYKRHYYTSDSYLVLSGKVTGALVNQLNKVFGSRSVQNFDGAVPGKFTETCKQQKMLIEKKDAMQTALRVGRVMPGKTDDDYTGLMLFNTLLGGYFGSRLMTSLREEKGLTYGVHSLIKNFRHGNYFTVTTEVNASQTAEAVDEIYKQIALLRNEPVGNDELQLVKNYLYGSFLRGFDGPFALADRFKNVRDFNLTFDFYKKQIDELIQLTSGDLQRIANEYFTEESLKLLAVGKVQGL